MNLAPVARSVTVIVRLAGITPVTSWPVRMPMLYRWANHAGSRGVNASMSSTSPPT